MQSSLLPKASKEFGSKSYWEDFFSKRRDVFDWYCEFPTLLPIIKNFCTENSKILVPGCGNSSLSENLYDIGYLSIFNIDISNVVIKSMITKNEKVRPKMKYLQMDIKKVINILCFVIIILTGKCKLNNLILINLLLKINICKMCQNFGLG